MEMSWQNRRKLSMVYDPLMSGYRKTSTKMLLDVISWFRNRCNMRDWDISFEIGPKYPSWAPDCSAAAASSTSGSYFEAWVYLNPDKCKSANLNPIAVVLHEMSHILLHANFKEDHSERFANTLEGILFRAWLQDHPGYKLKKGKLKKGKL